MVWVVRNSAHERVVQDLRNESDRAAGIIGASVLEDHLTAAIHRLLHVGTDDHDKNIKELFSTGRPIGDFGTKIRLGLALGIYGHTTFKDLYSIREIRNIFAHKLEYKNFSDDKIRDKTNNLVMVGKSEIYSYRHALSPGEGDDIEDGDTDWLLYDDAMKNPKLRFLLACQLFSAYFFNFCMRKSVRPRDPEFLP